MSIAFAVARSVFERTGLSKAVIAGIWLRFDDEAFPAEGWDDFATRILTSFAEATTRLLRADSSIERVSFMEGPLEVELQRLGSGRLALSGVERRLNSSTVRHEGEADLTVFAESLVGAAEQLLAWCREQGWRGNDEIALEQCIESLRAELTNRR